MSPSPGCGSSLVPASGTDQQTGPSPGSLLGLRTQGSGPSESGMCWTRRSKSGSDSGPDLQGHNTWVGGSSVTSQAGQWSRGLLAMERSRPDSEQVAAGAADTTSAAGPAGLIRSQSRRAADVGAAGRRKQRPAGARPRDGVQAEAVGSPGTVSHRNQPGAEAQRRAARMWNGHVRPLV